MNLNVIAEIQHHATHILLKGQDETTSVFHMLIRSQLDISQATEQSIYSVVLQQGCNIILSPDTPQDLTK